MIREYRHMWYFHNEDMRRCTEPDSLFPKKYKRAYLLYNPFNRERKDVNRSNKHMNCFRWIRDFDFRSLLR